MWWSLITIAVVWFLISRSNRREEEAFPYYRYSINLFDGAKIDPDVTALWGSRWEKNSEKKKQILAKKGFHPSITYYPKLEAYKVSTESQTQIITREDCDGINNIELFNVIVAGDDNGFEPHISYSVWERLIKLDNNKSGRYLSVVKTYSQGLSKRENDKVEIVCELPLFSLDDQKLEQFQSTWQTIDRTPVLIDFKDPFGEKYYPSGCWYVHQASQISFYQ